jgi:hypothetical protein
VKVIQVFTINVFVTGLEPKFSAQRFHHYLETGSFNVMEYHLFHNQVMKHPIPSSLSSFETQRKFSRLQVPSSCLCTTSLSQSLFLLSSSPPFKVFSSSMSSSSSSSSSTSSFSLPLVYFPFLSPPTLSSPNSLPKSPSPPFLRKHY